SGIDRAFDVNLGLLQPHFIQLEHKFYNFGSPALNVSSSSSTSDIGETWSLKHQVNLSPWSLSESFTQTEKQRVISGAIRRPLINKITASVAGNISFYRGMDITTYSAETGLDFPLYDGKFSVSRHWMSGLSQNDFSYDIRGTNSVEGLDLRFRLSLSDKGDKSFSAEANYRAAENIKLTLSIQSQSVIGTFSWNGVIGGKNSSSLWDKYDTGTVSGQIFDTREKGVNGKGIPMSGVLLQVGSESATTNDDGFFRVTNIPPDVPITARVDANSLDGTLAPEHEKDFMYLRKASHISWNPKIVPTIGLDGYLDATGGYEEGVKIEAMRLSDYVVVASSEVDSSDGFFVLEKLTPGKYQLSLNWPGRKIRPIEVTIKKNAEWITGARWDIDEATFEFAKGTQAAESRVLDKAIAPKTGGKSNKEEKDAVPVKIIATKEVELANKLRGLQNIIQIKLHSAEISKDEDAKKRIDTYKRLISITDKIESDWANISEQKKEESIVKIKKLLTSKNLAQDEINVELLKKLRLDLSNRVEKLRSRPTAKTIKKVDIYMRLDKIIEALQKDWDKLSLDERATKIDGIKKIFLGMEKQ
ncbi:MAG: hypothetical protein WCQ47_07475, partial [bacterium]